MTLSPQRLAEWRAQPDRAAIRRWESRTYEAARSRLADAFPADFRRLQREHPRGTARTELAHRYPAEFLKILDAIRDADPRPEAAEEQQRGEAADAA